MHNSDVFAAELTEARERWRDSEVCLNRALMEDYSEVLPDDGFAENPPTPVCLRLAAEARLQPDADDHQYERNNRGGGRLAAARFAADGGEELIPTMSLHSPPLLLFFLSLLPWSLLDTSGLRVEPLGWRDVGIKLVSP